MASKDVWDAPSTDSEDDDLDDDWDVDPEEKAAAKAEAERLEKEKIQKMKELQARQKAEQEAKKAAKAALLAERNRVLTEAEKEEAQINAQMDLMGDMMGQTDISSSKSTTAPVLVESENDKLKRDEKNIYNFKPKTFKEFKQYGNMIADQMYQFKDHKFFNQFVEHTVHKIVEKQNFENYMSVRHIANSMSALSNEKQTQWNNKHKKKKTKNKGISLNTTKSAATFDLDGGDYDYGDEDDFM